MDLLQQMLQTGQLCDFIEELIQIMNEEVNEKTMWEYYLHRVFDKSFAEFMALNKEPEAEAMDNERMTEIVKDSLEILARQ